MSIYTGTLVSRELGLEIPPTEGFQELLGMALRVNKKRAHLLVSNVLGKHVPQSPQIIAKAVHALAVQIANSRVSTVDAGELQQALVKELVEDINEPRQPQRLPVSALNENITVFGYAETATGLGALLAYYLGAGYIHSTRYPRIEATYGSFDEEHSHATSHSITPQDWALLNDASKTIILADDELTTGKTVMNTIRLLEKHAHHDEYFVATLTDLRTEEYHKNFRAFELEMNVNVRVVSLVATELPVPEDALAKAELLLPTLIESLSTGNNRPGILATVKLAPAVRPLNLGYSAKELRLLGAQARNFARQASSSVEENILVLGVEENMFLPLMVAYELELMGKEVKFSSSTQSPVMALDNSEYAIQSKLTYNVPDSEKPRFAYNVSRNFEQIITFSETPEDTQRNREFFTVLQSKAPRVLILEGKETLFNTPLEGPAFGSYSPSDVRWLLKDISDLELEAPAEEREEAIQNGEAHYAESLPVEYTPSPEYQELFLASLQANKGKLAEAIAFVSEQIYAARDGKPVLVSLARAGTPVGVLVKRYLKLAHNYDAPHYAVSIVRGKGIDVNALGYLAENYDTSRVFFVDGWTGKGAITKELAQALEAYESAHQVRFDPSIAVLADPGSCVEVYGTREDYLIPSACLNSTVSGLVSRTVLNEAFIGENDYHGGKFYRELATDDVSNLFVNEVSALFTQALFIDAQAKVEAHVAEAPTWTGWAMVEKVSEEYGINNVNLVKPGVGETTRVLLRRVPWRVLIRPQDRDQLKHILMLADQRGVEVEDRADLPYACIGLIHPRFTRGATGDDGKGVAQ